MRAGFSVDVSREIADRITAAAGGREPCVLILADGSNQLCLQFAITALRVETHSPTGRFRANGQDCTVELEVQQLIEL